MKIYFDMDEYYGTLSKNVILKNEPKYIWIKLYYGTLSKKKKFKNNSSKKIKT